MALPFKIHALLSREELDELEAFAREPGRTIDACCDWLEARGFVINRSAVGTWKRHFHLTDRFGASNAAARALMEAAAEGGTVAIADAATLQLGQMVFEKMISLQDDKAISTKDIWGLSMALRNVVTGKRHVEKLRGEVANAIKVAEKESRKGASGEQIVSKLREALGISDQSEPEPKLLTVPPEGRVVEDQP